MKIKFIKTIKSESETRFLNKIFNIYHHTNPKITKKTPNINHQISQKKYSYNNLVNYPINKSKLNKSKINLNKALFFKIKTKKFIN